MLIDVVNVGDGACTVIRHRDETMVMDCGSWHSKDGRDPALLLRATLGATAPIPSTVVVTHFDLDHWMGLKAFADASAAGSQRVQLIYPRFPARAKLLQSFLLAYQTMNLTAPERSALDLFRAWESKSAQVVRRSVCAGDRFAAVGTDWDVFWPPPELGPKVSKVFDEVAHESEELSQEYEPLRRALDWAYGSQFLADDPEETNDVNDEWAPDIQEDDEVVDEVDLLGSYGDDDFADAPHGLRERLQNNRRDVQRLNNELSLVVGEDDRRLLNFGDVQGWGLNELLRGGDLERCYETILAPHHGTQIPGKRTFCDFPFSREIIAQNGPGHRPRLKAILGSRTHGLISTADVGTYRGWWW